MRWKELNASKRFLVAAFLGGFLGLLSAGVVRSYLQQQESPVDIEETTRSIALQDADTPVENPAWHYAQAFQRGDWDSVIAKTLWMQERLAFLRDHPENGMDEASSLESLRAILRVRDKAKNRITPEGVEDQYLFKTDALLEIVKLDEGRAALAQPTAQRTWIRVTYPRRVRAILDADGMPIKSLLVGVNTTDDGVVLKASIVGNSEIAYNSLSYDWETP